MALYVYTYMVWGWGGVSIPTMALPARHCQGDTVLIIQQENDGECAALLLNIYELRYQGEMKAELNGVCREEGASLPLRTTMVRELALNL